jgi:hypothetical protein
VPKAKITLEQMPEANAPHRRSVKEMTLWWFQFHGPWWNRWLALFGLGACVVWQYLIWQPIPKTPVDWSAGLRRASPEHFSPRDDVDGWPLPKTTIGVAVLNCVKPNSAGPHAIPTLAQREAVLACAKAW